MSQKQHGRRAAETRVKTPLSELTEALSASSGSVGRRAAVAVAAGGLLTSIAVPTAASASKADEGQVSSADSQQKVEFKSQAASKVAETKASTATAGTVSVAKVTAKKAVKPTGTTDAKTASSSDSVDLPDGSKAEQVISIAKSFVGTPYVWGGKTTSGWDCSGFTSYVYRQVGVSLASSSSAQRSQGHVVSRSEAKPGDLMWHPGHVGIYAGNGKMIDARGKKYGTVYTSASWMSDAIYIRVL